MDFWTESTLNHFVQLSCSLKLDPVEGGGNFEDDVTTNWQPVKLCKSI